MTDSYICDSNDHRALYMSGLIDLWAGLKLWRIWTVLGYRDFLNQSRGTLLGPFWSLLGTGITTVALGYVYGSMFGMDNETAFPYIAAGLVLWFFVTGSTNGGLTVFNRNQGVIREVALPLSFSVYRYTVSIFVELCFKFIVFAGAALWVGLAPTWNLLYVVPSLLLYLVIGFSLCLFFGPIGTRFRDMQQLMGPVMLIFFLVTPVLWQPSMLASRSFIVDYNPFAHFLAIVREPLLGHPPPTLSVAIVSIIAAAIFALAVAAYGGVKNRLVFWL